ncbi:MAG: DUF6851 domain-containing protein [Chloroflexota bacterium]
MLSARVTRRGTGQLAAQLAAGAVWLRPIGAAADAFAAGETGVPLAPNAVLRWNTLTLDTIRRTRPATPVAARALAILHTAMYDAWAAYDEVAVGTRLGGDLRRPPWERTAENKTEAVSFAAYRVLSNLFPGREGAHAGELRALGYNPAAGLAALAGGASAPAAVGTLAALALLDYRHKDGSNQLGDRVAGAYADYTGYAPVNSADAVVDPNKWQPLRVADGQGVVTVQKCVLPQWGRVTPFGMANGAQLRPAPPPPMYPSAEYKQRADELLEISATLGESRKIIAEYWEGGPGTTTPPGHWHEFAQWVSLRDGHDLNEDVALFFALANALMDASIASWDCKQAIDYVRPITAVRYLYKGKNVRSWGGPYQGATMVEGAEWQPYQRTTFLTPAFPEFVSGHSTFSAAAAEVLKRFTGSDVFRASYTRSVGSSQVEPAVTPVNEVTLAWETFSAAADQAGMSRRYGGIHFEEGDLLGRAMGRQVGGLTWERAQSFVSGTAPRA